MKSLAPVKNKFPTEAAWKLKTEEGRARFTISRFIVLRKDRISSRLGEDIDAHKACLASTIESHSSRAADEETEVKRWLNRVFKAVFSRVVEGINLTSRPVGNNQQMEFLLMVAARNIHVVEV